MWDILQHRRVSFSCFFHLYLLISVDFVAPVMDTKNFFKSLTQDESVDAYVANMPPLICIPTTSGTGSEGGRSSVITCHSKKRVIGHPSLLPKYVALDPTVTVSMPPKLTFATGIDALFHCLEAFFVLDEVARSEGMSQEMIDICDKYAKSGTSIILKSLPKVMKQPDDLGSRLNMQIAAFYGAKAFRKGDLGAIHASAHALGSKYHLHHGESIGRMSVPVLIYNQRMAAEETLKKFSEMLSYFEASGYSGNTLAEAVYKFIQEGGIEYGIKDMQLKKTDITRLAQLATADPCSTNPVPMTVDAYKEVFDIAKNEPTFNLVGM